MYIKENRHRRLHVRNEEKEKRQRERERTIKRRLKNASNTEDRDTFSRLIRQGADGKDEPSEHGRRSGSESLQYP